MPLSNFSLLLIPVAPFTLVRVAWISPCCQAIHCAVFRTAGETDALVADLQSAAADASVVHLTDALALIDTNKHPSPLYVADDPCDKCVRELPAALQLHRHDAALERLASLRLVPCTFHGAKRAQRWNY